MERIGLGLITYKAPHKIKQSAPTVPSGLTDFVIVNDGTPYDSSVYPASARVITHEKNRGVGAAKNTAITALMASGCDHLFLMEDDVLIKNNAVFDAYISAFQTTGIQHFNFAYQGPSNYRNWRLRLPDKIRSFVLSKIQPKSWSDRKFDESRATFSPKLIVAYPNQTRIALHNGCPGAFSYYTRAVIQQIGLMDERYINAGEHLDHTYRISQAKLCAPFWWFADIDRSYDYLCNIENCIDQSTIAAEPHWDAWCRAADKLWKDKHGFLIREVPRLSQGKALEILNEIYRHSQQSQIPDAESPGRIKPLFKWGGLAY